MKLTNISLKNFLSFEDFEYNFLEHPVLVQGENITSTQMDSQESNGSGKSSLGSGISYAIMQEALRRSDLQDCDLIRWGCDKAIVSLKIYCELREEFLIIKRTIPIKGSTKLDLSIEKSGNIEPVKFSTVKDGNNYILEWLGGISKDDLKSYFLINKENYKSFFSSSNSDKIKIISRFSKSDKIDNVFPIIENDVLKLTSEISSLNKEIDRYKGQLEVYKENLEFESNIDFESEKQKKIDEINFKIEKVKSKLEDLERSKKEYLNKISECSKTVDLNLDNISKINDEIETGGDTIDFSDIYLAIDESIKELEKDCESNKKEISNKSSNKKDFNKRLSEIEVCLMGTISCPKCGYKWVNGHDELSIDELESEKDKMLLNIERTQDEIDRLNENLLKVEEQIKEFIKEKSVTEAEERSFKERVDTLKRKIRSYDSENNDLKLQIERYNKLILDFDEEYKGYINNINHYLSEIEDIKNRSFSNEKISELENKISELENKISELENKLNGLESDLTEISSWKFKFKDFKMELSKESLNVIQININRFLEAMNSDLRVMIEGYKKLASGDIREEITPYVVRDSIKKFGSFSGGERARMEIAMILAIQYMINSTNPYGGLHFLNIDEVTEGMDPLGVSMMMKSLDNMNFCMLVTTHVTARNLYHNNLIIVKENGISRLKDE